VHFVRVEENNRWWDHHNEHLRGEGYYRKAPERHENRHGDRREDRRDEYRNDRRDGDQNPRYESRRGER
jgi:hypothetical protein